MKLLKIIEIAGALASISAWVMAYFQWKMEGLIESKIASVSGVILFLITILVHQSITKNLIDLSFDILSDELFVVPQPAEIMIGQDTDEYIHRIHYPRHFKSPPNLQVECVKNKAKIKILIEKENYFTIKAIRTKFPEKKRVKIKWIAKGQFTN